MAIINIGETLRDARLKKNITLAEMQQITKIQTRYLEAIENNDYGQLPSQFYVRSFLKQYAEAVGLDGQHILDIYDGKDQVLPSYPEVEAVESSRRKNKHEGHSRRVKFEATLPMVALGLVALAIVIVVGYYVWLDSRSSPLVDTSSSLQVEGSISSSSSQSTAASSTTEETSSSSEVATMSQAIASNSTTAATINLENAASPLNFTFTASERCWVGLSVNGSLVFNQTLAAGESGTVALPDNTTAASISVGVASYASIQINGTELDFQPAESLNAKTITLNIAYAQ